MALRRSLALLVSLVLLAPLACSDEESTDTPEEEVPAEPEPLPFEPAGPAAAPDPSEPGPYPVGVRTVTFTDRSRPRLDGSPRELVTEIWYPAKESARGQPGVAYDIKSVLTEEQLVTVGSIEVPLLETTAVRDAEIRDDRGRFPVIVFSHGQGSIRWQSTYYTVALASHGFVVVSPDHPGNTLADLARDQLSPTAEGLETRPGDVSFLLDTITALGADDPVRPFMDLSRIGVTGHSFGALTSFRVAAMDSRVDVIVPQAPTSNDINWLGLPPPVTLSIPVLIQGGHRDRTLPWDEHVATSWATLTSPRWLADFVNGGHFTFSDLCAFDLATIAAETGIGEQLGFGDVTQTLQDGCLPPAPEALVAQKLINLSAIGLFNAVLHESPGSYGYLDQAHHDQLGDGVVVFTSDP